jgi:hypothetical protein
MKIKVDKINDNILLFKFKKVSDISLTFFRVQEYYESQNKKLLGKKFSVFDFIVESIDKEGFIPYFFSWSGFNVPCWAYNEWFDLFKYEELTEYEKILSHLVRDNRPEEGKFYIIAALEKDKSTIDHELAHALYYLNPAYRADMQVLTHSMSLHFPDNYNTLKDYLKELGYNEKVYDDEIQAYLATEKTARLKDPDDFGLKCGKKFLKYVEDYRNYLTEYKTTLDTHPVV